MHLLRKHIIKLSTVGILAVSIDPCLKIKDEYIEKKKILFELNNRHKIDNKYYNYPIDIIDGLYGENSNIDIDKLLISNNKIKTICNIPTYILFKPIQLYLKHINRKEDIKKGLYKNYYGNGQVSEMLEILNYNDGKKNGYYKSYYSDGTLRDICNYTDGKRNGEYKLYYMNGKLCVQTNYTDGKINGMYKSYYESGELKLQINTDGTYEEYNENGIKIE